MLPPYLWSKIRAVFFDAEGTLLHIHPSVGHIYAQVARAYGLEVAPQEMQRRFGQVFRSQRLRQGLSPESCYENWKQIFLETVEHFGPLADPDRAFEECYQAFARREFFALSPGTREVLAELHRSGRKLGVISNWDARLPLLLEDFGLAPFFQVVLTSCEVGLAKPDPRLFLEGCRVLRVLPEEALMVGDNLEEDVLGARKAGLWALRYPGGDLRRLFPL